MVVLFWKLRFYMIKLSEKITKYIRDCDMASYALAISMFFLPLNLKLNNLFLVLFFILFVFEGNFNSKLNELKINYKKLIPTTTLFFIIVFGYTYSTYTNNAFSQIERMLPLFLLPLFFVSNPYKLYKHIDKYFFGLVLGCILSALITWGWLTFEFFFKKNGWNLFSWKYSKNNLIVNLGQHTPYISMFIFISIGFIISKLESKIKNKNILRTACVVLIVFLIQLSSRTAIIYFLGASIIYLAIKKYFSVLVVLLLLILAFFSFLVSQENNYYKKILVDEIGLSGIDKIDSRFERWNNSYELFYENPIFGVGSGDVEVYRLLKYRKNGDMDAYKEKYNAHNQLLEFLSSQGLIGGFTYLLTFAYIIYLSLRSKNKFYLFTIIGIFICCLTESMFRRSWGVICFSFVYGLVVVESILKLKYQRTNLT